MNELSYYPRLCDRIGVGLLVCTAASLIASALLSAVLYIVAPAFSENMTALLIISNICTYLIAPAAMLAVIGKLPEGALPDRSVTSRRFGKLTVEGLGLIFGLSIVTNGLILAISALTGADTTNVLDAAMTQLTPGLAFLFMVIIAPVFEEVIFRRLLLDRLLFLGDWTALLLSSLFFGLFHTNLYQFLYATVVGMVLGYIRIITGRMRWNVLLHMFINLFCGVLPNYLYDNELYTGLLGLTVIASIVYAIRFLIRNRPWKELYAGPVEAHGNEKLAACLTSVPFWICVLFHLGLSVYNILPA